MATSAPTEQAQDAPRPRRSRAVRTLVAGAVLFVCVLAIVFLRPYEVPSRSMEPLLHERDRIVAVLFEGRVNPPSLGDVVVLHHRLPDGGTEMVVKRIVGVGGDRLRTVQGQLIRNGRVMPEPYVPEPMIDWWPPPQVLVGLLPPQLPMEGDAYVVPDGQVIVMGDNRNYSEDSRDWGPIAESELVGRVVAIYWPRDRIGRAR